MVARRADRTGEAPPPSHFLLPRSPGPERKCVYVRRFLFSFPMTTLSRGEGNAPPHTQGKWGGCSRIENKLWL